MACGKRPAQELYRISSDRYCMHNLASIPAFETVRQQLESKLLQRLHDENDPRTNGPADYFERMPYAEKSGQGFYERFAAGEQMKAGWGNLSDFEPEPIEQ